MIRQELVKRRSDAPANARLGAVSLIHRFGNALNEHIHFHCCIIDAVFSLGDGALRISELPTLNQAEIVTIQTRVSQRVLRWFVRRGWIDPDDAPAMHGSNRVAIRSLDQSRQWNSISGFIGSALPRQPAQQAPA